MSNKEYKALTAEDIAENLLFSAECNERLLIVIHKSPDGDAIGSAFALKMIYEALSGDSEVISSDGAPDYLKFLIKGQATIKYTGEEVYDRIITVDTASPSQMGDLHELCDKVSFSIDHHAICTPFSDCYRDGNAAAAGEMIYKVYNYLIEKGKITQNAEICRSIYCAISADTGSFQYSNTTSDTHIIASELISVINSDKNGRNTAELARLLHNSKSMNTLKAEKLCIDALTVTDDGRIAYVLLEKKNIKACGIESEDFGAAVDIPRSVAGVQLAFVLKETGELDLDSNKIYKISARSSCSVSVAAICQKFGGGGHEKAAGANISAKNAKIAVETVLSEFRKALEGK